MWENQFNLLIATIFVLVIIIVDAHFEGVARPKCPHDRYSHYYHHENSTEDIYHQRLIALRHEMRNRASVQTQEIDAYILPSTNEHLSEDVSEADKRIKLISGYTGSNAKAVITLKHAALWVDEQFVKLANEELSCEWRVFKNEHTPYVFEWLGKILSPESRIGIDPQLIPHHTFQNLEQNLKKQQNLQLVKVNKNLVDYIWGEDRPPPPSDSKIMIHEVRFAGQKWEQKISYLRTNISSFQCDAIVLSSLPEIAYLLNIRGNDVQYLPVFKAYMIISMKEIILYVNKNKIGNGLILHLNSHHCNNANCVQIKNYHEFWGDLRTLQQQWTKVLIPGVIGFESGSSEAIYSLLRPSTIMERPSPVIFMKATKNLVEREGMRKAHVKDGAAYCEALSVIEDRFMAGEDFTESTLASKIDFYKKIQDDFEMLAYKTVISFGNHARNAFHTTDNLTKVNETASIIIESGSHYLDGTTDFSRTIYFGDVTVDQRRDYTKVLIGLIHLATLPFSQGMKLQDLDTIARGSVWKTSHLKAQGKAHGIGSYLSVMESPISAGFSSRRHRNILHEGYFFSDEQEFRSEGIKLGNVLEVKDSGGSMNENKMLEFRVATLIPFEPKLIDKSMLTAEERKFLNDYNAQIREHVGDYLKRKIKMQAFYWMMNKTKYIYSHEDEDYHHGASTTIFKSPFYYFIVFTTIFLTSLVIH